VDVSRCGRSRRRLRVHRHRAPATVERLPRRSRQVGAERQGGPIEFGAGCSGGPGPRHGFGESHSPGRCRGRLRSECWGPWALNRRPWALEYAPQTARIRELVSGRCDHSGRGRRSSSGQDPRRLPRMCHDGGASGRDAKQRVVDGGSEAGGGSALDFTRARLARIRGGRSRRAAGSPTRPRAPAYRQAVPSSSTVRGAGGGAVCSADSRRRRAAGRARPTGRLAALPPAKWLANPAKIAKVSRSSSVAADAQGP